MPSGRRPIANQSNFTAEISAAVSIQPFLTAIGESYRAVQQQLEAALFKIREHEATIEVLQKRLANFDSVRDAEEGSSASVLHQISNASSGSKRQLTGMLIDRIVRRKSGGDFEHLIRIKNNCGEITRPVSERERKTGNKTGHPFQKVCAVCRKYPDKDGNIVYRQTAYCCKYCLLPLCHTDKRDSSIGRNLTCQQEHFQATQKDDILYCKGDPPRFDLRHQPDDQDDDDSVKMAASTPQQSATRSPKTGESIAAAVLSKKFVRGTVFKTLSDVAEPLNCSFIMTNDEDSDNIQERIKDLKGNMRRPPTERELSLRRFSGTLYKRACVICRKPTGFCCKYCKMACCRSKGPKLLDCQQKHIEESKKNDNIRPVCYEVEVEQELEEDDEDDDEDDDDDDESDDTQEDLQDEQDTHDGEGEGDGDDANADDSLNCSLMRSKDKNETTLMVRIRDKFGNLNRALTEKEIEQGRTKSHAIQKQCEICFRSTSYCCKYCNKPYCRPFKMDSDCQVAHFDSTKGNRVVRDLEESEEE